MCVQMAPPCKRLPVNYKRPWVLTQYIRKFQKKFQVLRLTLPPSSRLFHLQSPERDSRIGVERSVSLHRPEGVGLGFNIIGGEGSVGIFISYIYPDSVADQLGQLYRGDKILSVSRP